MPTVGNTSQGASTGGATEDQAYATQVNTTTEEGTVDALHAWLIESTAAGAHDVDMALYDSSNNLITNSQTDMRTDIPASMGDRSFTYSGTAPSIATSTLYKVAFRSTTSGDGVCQFAYDDGASGDGYDFFGENYSASPWPSSLSWSDRTAVPSFYIEYTAAGGGGGGATPKNRTFHGPFGSPVLTGPL